jgi:hypothetical protein
VKQGSGVVSRKASVVAPRSGPKDAAVLTLLEQAHAAGLVVDFRSGVISLPAPVLRELLDGRRRSALRTS